jgi:transcriptional regulator with XRE-family HTH domain
MDIEERVSEKLRALRHKRGLTLAECEVESGGRFKPVVLGSYERGTRAVSLQRLQELADFYQVPLVTFFHDEERAFQEELPVLIFDLRRIAQKRDERDALASIRNFLTKIVEKRMDFNGEILSIRGGDLETLELLHLHGRGELLESMAKNGYLFAHRMG